MTHFDFQFTWSKIKVKLFVFVQMLFAPYFVTPFQESCQTRYSPSNVLLSHFCVRSPLFTVRSPSVHHAFIVRSSCVNRSQFCVQRSLFARVHRSQSVQRSLTVRSPIVHKTFIVHSAFSLHCHSELWSWKINITILERNCDKEVGLCFILKTWFFYQIKLGRIHRIS